MVLGKQALYISLGHPEGANAEQIRNFSGFSHVLVQCTKISFHRGGGGVCVCFLKSVRKGLQKPRKSGNSQNNLGETGSQYENSAVFPNLSQN